MCISGITIVTTLFIYFQVPNPSIEKQSDFTVGNEFPTPTTPVVQKFVYVDVSGAVNNPDVYKLRYGARLYDAVEKAGGLSTYADEAFIKRNINFARILSDQEKVYIPTFDDVQFRHVDEYVRVFNETFIPPTINLNNNQEQSLRININSSPVEELDSLPGIGPVLGQKIIDGRPYESIDHLLQKKIVSESVFEKIKHAITVSDE